MALISCDFFSETLEMGASATVVLPQATTAQIGVADGARSGPPPVLYLLHGLSDDHTAWTRYTSIERYANEAGLAVVMPAVARSFYANERQGYRYWDFMADELPQLMRSFFRFSEDPAETFVAGLSMGGYGALKLALNHPDRYAAAASLSGALDLAQILDDPDRDDLRDRVFAGSLEPGEDLFALLAERTSTGRTIPRLHVSCGTEDWLFPDSQRFVEEATAAGLDLTVDFRPGDHEWGLWDTEIREVIAWLVSAM